MESEKNFIVYKSSAGSGKTYRLALEYIKLLLVNPRNYRKILAATFTNKAANEMKSKILGYLKQLASINLQVDDDLRSDFYQSIKTETKLPDNIIKANASIAFTSILHDYSDFSVMTIDKFTTKIARSFQYDLQIENDFEIDLKVDDTVKNAINNLYALAGLNSNITNILTQYIVECINDNRVWQSDELIQNFSKQIQKESARSHLKRLENLTFDDFREFLKWSHKFIREYRETLRNIGLKGIDIFKNHSIDPELLHYKRKGIYSQFLSLCDEKDDVTSYANYSFIHNKWFNDKTSKSEQDRILPVIPQFVSLNNQFLETREHQTIEGFADHELFQSLILVNRNIYGMSLFQEIKQVINDYKTLNNLVFLSELNEKIGDHVANESAPYIYERIGNQYNHILLDEFQDNSLLQWRNFIPLVENSLASNNLCLIVGDGKQSIYRWRNGVVEQFAALPLIYQPPDNSELWKIRESQLRNQFDARKLTENFRSARVIVEFNNIFFNYLNQRFKLITGNIYSDIEQTAKKDIQGFISVEFFEKNNTENQGDEILNRIYNIVKSQVHGAYQFSDIAILCRKNKTACLIASYLMSKNIPVVSSESIVLSGSFKVQLIISFFRLLSTSDFKFYSSEILGLLRRMDLISPEQYDIFIKRVIRLSPKTQEKYKELFLLNLHEFDRVIDINKTSWFSLYEKAEYLSQVFGFMTYPDPFMVFFLQNIKEYSIQNGNIVEDFLIWWDSIGKKKSIIIPADHNAINIMTIHKAKGLQFPIVIYPFANDRIDLSGNSFWVEGEVPQTKINTFLVKGVKALEKSIFSEQYLKEKNNETLDLINLLYVVLTRATNKNYILADSIKKPETSESISGFLLTFLKEIQKQPESDGNFVFGMDDAESECINENLSFEEKIETNEKWFSDNWHNRATISRQKASKFFSSRNNQNREKGNLIHFCLSKINYKWDVEMAINQLINLGLIQPNEPEQFRNMIEKVVNHPVLEEYFSSKYELRLETEILMPNGNSLRPDRIMIEKNKAHIIDYKTGDQNDSHMIQIKTYAQILGLMGYEIEKLFLVYITAINIDILEVKTDSSI